MHDQQPDRSTGRLRTGKAGGVQGAERIPEQSQEPAAEQAPRTLWRHRNFLLLWSGQTVSEIGSAVSQLALPLTAVVLLRASTFQVGLLTSATTAAFALIALPAGALVDRRSKRRVNPILRKIAACTGTSNFFSGVTTALEIIFLVRVLHVRPAHTGLLFAVAGLGGWLAGSCPADWPGRSARPA
jgi:MFS family permease